MLACSQTGVYRSSDVRSQWTPLGRFRTSDDTVELSLNTDASYGGEMSDKPLKISPQQQQSTDEPDPKHVPPHVAKPTTTDESKRHHE